MTPDLGQPAPRFEIHPPDQDDGVFFDWTSVPARAVARDTDDHVDVGR